MTDRDRHPRKQESVIYSQVLFFFFFFFFCHTKGLQDLSSPPEIDPQPLAMRAQSPNHLTTREFPGARFFFSRVEGKALITNATIQFSSIPQLCRAFCGPMDCSMPGLPIHHQLLEPTQTHVHRISDAIQPSHPLSSPSPPAFNLSQHQGLFQ